MRTLLLAAVLALVPLAASAQEPERKVPADSARISVQGCAKGRSFVTTEPIEHEPTRSMLPAGRRFRLNASKAVLKDIKKQEGMMIEVTGLVRKTDLREPGIPVAGGRVRVGGGAPQAPLGGGGVTSAPMFSQAVLDLEAWRPLGESCPKRDR